MYLCDLINSEGEFHTTEGAIYKYEGGNYPTEVLIKLFNPEFKEYCDRSVGIWLEVQDDEYPCILEIYDFANIIWPDTIGIVMRKYECDLYDYITWLIEDSGNNTFNHSVRNESIIYQMTKAVFTLHIRNLAVGDMKPDNILIDTESGKVVLGDLGTIGYVGEKLGLFTPLYSPYEVVNGCVKVLTKEHDIFSLGVMIHYLYYREFPFPIRTINHNGVKRQYISDYNYKPVKNGDIDLNKLLIRCLSMDPENRPTIEEIMDSPFFKKCEENCWIC